MEITNLLESTRQEFFAATEGVTESQATAKPETGGWSILECVEHVATVESLFLTRLEKAQRLAAPHIDGEREARLMALTGSRATRVQAPEMSLPTGRFATLEEALGHFRAERSRAIEVTAERGQDLYMVTVDHARLGALNGVELMIVIAGHARRHALQIREIRGM